MSIGSLAPTLINTTNSLRTRLIYLLVLFFMCITSAYSLESVYHSAGYKVTPSSGWWARHPDNLSCIDSSIDAVFNCLDITRAFNSPLSDEIAGWTSVSLGHVGNTSAQFNFEAILFSNGTVVSGNVQYTVARVCEDGYYRVDIGGQSLCAPIAKDNLMCSVANPVATATGEKIQNDTDINLGGLFPIEFNRTYHSMHESVPDLVGTGVGVFGGSLESDLASMGKKWDHSYNLALTGDLDTDFIYIWASPADGTEQSLSAPIQEVYDADPALFSANIKAYRNNGAGYVFANTFNPQTQCFEADEWSNREASIIFRMTIVDRCASKGQRVFKLDNGVHYEMYNSSGKLIGLESYSGISQAITYEAGNIKTIAHSLGYSIELFYANKKVDYIQDNTGRIWNYEYDANENLEYVYNPDGTFVRYFYATGSNKLIAINDERAKRFANFEYFNDKAVASYHGPSTTVTTDRLDGVSLSFNQNKTSATNSNGGLTDFNFSNISGYLLPASVSGVGCFLCGATDVIYSYDPGTLDLSSITEYGLRTEFADFDSYGQPQTITEAAGTPPVQRQKTYAYDPRYLSKFSTITEPSVLAGSSKVTTNTYDDYGNTLSVTVTGKKPDNTDVSRTITYKYEGPFHQLSEIDGPRGNSDVSDIYSIRYYPDLVSSGNNRARMLKVTAPEGVVLLDSAQYTATGKMTYYTDSNGRQVGLDYYPGNDRLATMTVTGVALGTVRKTHWSYLATGEVQTITRGYQTSDASTITLEYDAARRLTRVYDGLNNYIQYTLDTESNVKKEEIFDAGGALYKQLSQTFDAYNRLDVRSQLNETMNANIKPSGDIDELIDGKLSKTKYDYDALRRLTTVTQNQAGTDPTTADALTQMAYDSQDNITQVTAPNGAVTTYVYDDLGNLLATTSADTGTTSYTHDAAGNVLSRSDAKGQLTSYTYDALNRVSSIDLPGTENDVTYSYDSCQKGNGRVCTITRPVATVHNAYDAEGNLLNHQALRYSYDAAGRVKTISYPSGAVVSYAYDLAGQVSRVTLNRNGVITTLASNVLHHPFGPVSNLQYGNGLSYNQVYDQAYRVFSQQVGSVFNLSYNQYDANGNLQNRTDNIAASTETYSYDALDRLDTAAGSFGSRDYDYDKNGNRSRLDDGSITPYTYETNSNRMSQQGSVPVTLDANGNTETRGTQTLSYTPDNRLYQVFDNGTLVATYAYNGLGQRVLKQLPDGTGRRFSYGLDGKLLVETDINGNILHEYVFMNDRLLARYDADSNGNGLTNSEEDALGSNPFAPDDDGDGLSNLAELYTYGTDPSKIDTDGDGITDQNEIIAGTDPLQASANPFLLGDINMDGQINVGDLVLMQQFVLKTRSPDAQQLYLADINQDAVVDIRDLLKLSQQILNTASNDESYFGDMLHQLAGWILEQVPAAMAAAGNGQIYYIHSDHLGTPKAMTDEAGVTVWRASHDPFGKATVTANSGVVLNVRFPGQYFDSESGLHYNYYRTYDPGTGRYITSDPIGLNGGVNTFGYVGGNPVMLFDLFGLNPLNAPGSNWGLGMPSGYGPYLEVTVGAGVNVGSTTIGVDTGNDGLQWGQTTAVGLGAGFEFCFMPIDSGNENHHDNASGDSSCENDSQDDWPRLPDGVQAGWKYLGISLGSGKACVGVGATMPGSLPAGVYWN